MKLTHFALTLSGLMLSTVCANAGTVYLDDSNGVLYAGDPTTGVYNTVGNSTASVNAANGNSSFSGFTDIGFAAGILYGLDSSGNLFSINTSTAAATKIGPTGIANPSGVVGLSDSISGVLIAGGQGAIYSLNTSTGAGTLIGTTGQSYNTSGDDTFANGTLYLTSTTPTADSLFSVNTTTGVGTGLGTLENMGGSAFTNVFGMIWDTQNSTMYAYQTGGVQFDVNLANPTQSGTVVTDTGTVSGDNGLLGAAFIASPEPGTMLLLGAGLTAVGYLRRRRR